MAITSVDGFVEEARAFRDGKERHAHVRLWFRGHADEEWKLEPGVYRSTFQPASESEEDRLLKERHLTQDFRVGSAGLRESQMSDEDLYFLQQHYGMPTRLLDWSGNALTALYFAVSDEDTNKNGAVYMLDAYQFERHPTVGYGIATSRRPAFKKAVAVIARWRDSVTSDAFPDVMFPVRPDRLDIRMSLQRAGFTFHVPKQRELTTAINGSLKKIIVSGGAKPGLKAQLAELGVDEFGVYGDLVSLAKNLKTAHEIRS
jgi:hypothetical protein